jgi:hypothetical protein
VVSEKCYLSGKKISYTLLLRNASVCLDENQISAYLNYPPSDLAREVALVPSTSGL